MQSTQTSPSKSPPSNSKFSPVKQAPLHLFSLTDNTYQPRDSPRLQKKLHKDCDDSIIQMEKELTKEKEQDLARIRYEHY